MRHLNVKGIFLQEGCRSFLNNVDIQRLHLQLKRETASLEVKDRQTSIDFTISGVFTTSTGRVKWSQTWVGTTHSPDQLLFPRWTLGRTFSYNELKMKMRNCCFQILQEGCVSIFRCQTPRISQLAAFAIKTISKKWLKLTNNADGRIAYEIRNQTYNLPSRQAGNITLFLLFYSKCTLHAHQKNIEIVVLFKSSGQ